MFQRYLFVGALVTAASMSFATDLTFANLKQTNGQPLTDGQPLSDTYGSHASGPDATWGVGIEGYTPNIGTSYYTGNLSNPNDPPHFFYQDSYGDLPNVGTTDIPGDGASITLSPDSGYGVTLLSFDMATDLSSDNASFIDIIDGSGHVLWTAGSDFIAGGSHVHFDPNISSNSPLILEFGNGTDLGISDIRFGQHPPAGTPEPFTLGLGCVGIGIAIRRIHTRRP